MPRLAWCPAPSAGLARQREGQPDQSGKRMFRGAFATSQTRPDWVQQLPREVLASLRRSLISWKAVVCAGSFGVRRADGCRQDSQYWWIVLHNARRWTLTVREAPGVTGGTGC